MLCFWNQIINQEITIQQGRMGVPSVGGLRFEWQNISQQSNFPSFTDAHVIHAPTGFDWHAQHGRSVLLPNATKFAKELLKTSFIDINESVGDKPAAGSREGKQQ